VVKFWGGTVYARRRGRGAVRDGEEPELMLYRVEGEEGRTAEMVGRGYTDGHHE
jgi:hypothetical protein